MLERAEIFEGRRIQPTREYGPGGSSLTTPRAMTCRHSAVEVLMGGKKCGARALQQENGHLQNLEKYSSTAQQLAYRGWHQVNRQEELPTGGGRGQGRW